MNTYYRTEQEAHRAEVKKLETQRGLTFIIAVRLGDKVLAKILLEAFAAADVVNFRDRTALYYAVKEGSEALVQLLLLDRSLAQLHFTLRLYKATSIY